MSAPRIGITGITRLIGGVDRTGVNVAYVQAVLAAGGVPLILSPVLGSAHNTELLDAIDGLLLSGGEDVAPERYGQAPHAALGTVDLARDAFELTLFHDARRRKLPVLAICRGIQLVNVALGGTLWQDIPSQRPSALHHTQPAARDTRSHPVTITPGSRLAQAVRTTRCEVNSFHHQSIRDLAPGLVVTATAPDGEIEGAESPPADPWLLAVQWHPEEFHGQHEAPDHGIFAALVGEATRRRGGAGVPGAG